ncbi:hypothetical protein CYMTET_28359 [Cymbomonas tetramitiformis]|uniref:Calponin-homology (CH) domain-containing protein n=1 Tax=Cymbomonas tetramitiformis TaxID=36881 RepID=A0AAE0FPI0_9CHLO|nr:hypothetical protein CYMTET_28359 [Cymbomonas tetramitiformis]
MDVPEDQLQQLYTWVDEIPLSRPKRNIARDFSDGVLVAEITSHYFPKYIELHNYSGANGISQKMYNWGTLNQKVFRKFGFSVNKADCEAVCNCVPGAIERVLKLLKVKIAKHRSTQSKKDERLDQPGIARTPAPTVPAAAPMPSPAPSTVQPQVNVGPQLYVPPGQPGHHIPQNEAQFVPAPEAYAQPSVNMQVPQAAPTPLPPTYGSAAVLGDGAATLLADREATIQELRETNEILETKVRKLEQLVRLKDAKVQTLMSKLQAAGIS